MNANNGKEKRCGEIEVGLSLSTCCFCKAIMLSLGEKCDVTK